MGYRSDVKILMANKAYDLLKNNCLASDNEEARKSLNEETGCLLEKISEESVLVYWGSVKWYYRFPDVSIVEDTLVQLDDMIMSDEDLLKDYYYKMITIGEDNAVHEATNDLAGEFTSDFYIECNFSL